MVGLSASLSSPSPISFGERRVAARDRRNVSTASVPAAAVSLCDPVVAEERLPVRESFLQLAQKTAEEIVESASTLANDLVVREMRGPGDMPNAMERLERRYSLPGRSFWSLRYRKPKTICASLFLKLLAAYEAERERQMRLHNHEIELTKAIAGASHAAVLAAEALVGADHV